jgi:ubiquinone biosynthesis accessory factor UbiJ
MIISRIAESLTNKILYLNPDNFQILAPHIGKVIAIAITNWKLCFYIVIQDHYLRLQNHNGDAQVTTTIKGSTMAFLRQLQKSSPTFIKDFVIEGDMELAEAMRDLLQKMQINGEEYLSYIVGDVVAHRFGSVWRNLQEQRQYSTDKLITNMADYLCKEKNYLPAHEEIEDFYDDINVLRHALERLEGRWNLIVSKNWH